MEAQPKIQADKEIWLLVATITASSMAMIDGTALNVALPALQKSLDITASQMLWVVNAYLLFLSSLLLLGGSIGDIYGRKKVFMLGIVLFTLSSAACGLSPNGQFLIYARAVQGIGGALMVPGSLTLIAALFPQEKKGWAIGTWSMFSALTTIFGPLLGGIFASLGLWRWVFFINLPLGCLALWILYKHIPESKSRTSKKLDYLGSFVITLCLGLMVYAFIEAAEKGFDQWYIWLMLIISFGLIPVFIRIERTSANPLIPIFLFANKEFSTLNLLTFLIYAALGSVLFFLPLNIIQVQGLSEIVAGLGILPFGILIALLARFSGKWVDQYGYRNLLIVGPTITAMGFMSFALIGKIDTPIAFLYTFLPCLILCGIGMGLTVVPLTTGIMSCINEDFTGVASGINNTVARSAGVIALAIFGAIALLVFQASFIKNTDTSILGYHEQAFINDELPKFAEATAPTIIDQAIQLKINNQVESEFLNVFNGIAIVGGALPALGALLVVFYIKMRKAV